MADWNKMTDEEKRKRYDDVVRTFCSLRDSGDLDEVAEESVEKLREAERSKDSEKAKEIRDYIEKNGVLLEYTKDGISWKWKS